MLIDYSPCLNKKLALKRFIKHGKTIKKQTAANLGELVCLLKKQRNLASIKRKFAKPFTGVMNAYAATERQAHQVFLLIKRIHERGTPPTSAELKTITNNAHKLYALINQTSILSLTGEQTHGMAQMRIIRRKAMGLDYAILSLADQIRETTGDRRLHEKLKALQTMGAANETRNNCH